MKSKIKDTIEVAMILLVLLGVGIYTYSECRRKPYRGIVVEKHITSAGYKVREKTQIIFYCEELEKNICVNVTENCYYNTKVGEQVSFSLNKNQIR